MPDEKRPALFEPRCMQTIAQLLRLGQRRPLVHGPESRLGMAFENASLGRDRAIHFADLREKVKHLLQTP